MFYILYIMSITRSVFRKHLSAYLAEIQSKRKPLIIWERAKNEFVIFPYPEDTAQSLFQLETNLQEKVLASEYYDGITQLMQDRWDTEHDDLFVS